MSGLQTVSMKKGRAALPRLSPVYVPGRHSERFWTDGEIAIVREHYPSGGASACLAKLPGRTLSGVYGQANKIGLKAPAMCRSGPRQRHQITPEIEARMREAWPTLTARGAISQFIENELKLPKWVVLKHAIKVGLARSQRKEPPWTSAELELIGKVPLHLPDKAAAIFREHGFSRTPTSIVIRAKRLGMSRRYKETLSASAAAKILGMDNKTLCGWCIAGELKAERREGTKRLPQQGGAPWSVKPADLRQFVIDNIARIDIRKVDKVAFVDLLVSTP